MDAVLDPRLAPPGGNWCACPDAPWFVSAPLTPLDHPDGCAFPAGLCVVRAHRVTIHAGCGREMPFRFCGCLPSGYSHDRERDWWVHYFCGWPTRAWLTEAGHLPPADLLGVKPVTYHEFLVVPRTPKAAFARLTEEQRRINAAWAGRWVRD